MEPGIRRSRPVELSSSANGVFKWPSPPSSSSSSSSSSSRSTCKPPKPSDYAEIFGGFAASCSIPVLDLPPPAADEDNFTTIDYFDIFGGFEATGLGVSYEELFFPREDLRNPHEIEDHGQSTAVKGFSKKDLTGKENLFSPSERIKTLNGGIGEFNLPYQKPKHGFEESTVTGGTDVSRNLNCTTELGGGVVGSNIRIAKSPTSLSTGTESSSDGHYSDQKLPEMKFNPSEDTSASDQYHSCSSCDQSAVDTDASFPCQSNAYEYSSVDNNGVMEENCFGLSTSTTSTSSILESSKNKTGNDQKQSTTITIASEKTTPFQHLHTHSHSSDDNTVSSTGIGIPSQSANGFNGQETVCNEKTNCQSQNPEFIMGKVEEKMPMKSVVPKSSVFVARNADNCLKEDQKQDFATASEDRHVNNQPHDDLSSNLSVSIDDRSMPSSDAKFLTVSDINLQTQPSQVPPPSRPPPRVCNDQGPTKLRKAESLKTHSDKSGYRQATCRRTNSLIGVSYTFKETGWNDLSDMDVSSAAAVSVAAMKEAMEQAQARLKSAKESMERKKDSLQGRKKSVLTEVSRNKDPKLVETNETPLGLKHQKILENSENNCSRTNDVTDDQRKKNSGVGSVASDIEANEKYFDLAEESLWGTKGEETKATQVSHIQDARAGEWKVEEQFFELVNNNKKPRKVQEFYELEAERKKTKACFKSNEEKNYEQTTNVVRELKNNDTFFTTDGDKEERSNNRILVEDSNNKVKDSSKAVEVDGKEDPRKTSEVCSQESEERIEEHSSGQQSDEYKKQQQDCINVKLNLITSEDASTFKEDRSDESSKPCFMGALPEYKIEELKAKSSVETHLADKSDEICADEEREHVVNASANDSVIAPDESSIISSREPKLSDTGREDQAVSVNDSVIAPEQSNIISSGEPKLSDTGTKEQVASANDSVIAPDESSMISSREPKLSDTGREEHAASQQSLCEVMNEDATLTEMMNSCENMGIDGKNEQVLQEDIMLKKEDIQKLTRIQESCKLTESNERTKEDCIKQQDMGVLDASEESIPCTENNKENETNEGASWQYFCEKIIRNTQVDLQQKEVKQNPAKVDDELIPQRNHEAGVDEHEVAPTSLEKSSLHTPSIKGGQNLNGMEQEDSEHTVILDPPSNMQKVSQTVAGPDSERNCNRIDEMLKPEEKTSKERVKMEMEREKERIRKLEEEKEREREREKDRLAFERASQEARDRAISESRETTEKAAVERANAEARHRTLAEARERAEKASNEALLLAEKASQEAKLKAERAAVERATAEARERAIERALAEKARKEAKEHGERSYSTGRDKQRKDNESNVHSNETAGMRHSSSFTDMKDFPPEQRYSDPSNNGWRPESESAIRCKARLERHQRTVERAAKALAEKNLRDILVQREQAERNRIAETLDADVRRWSNGKEGNLRALLSTLQYILGPESGWQPISLTDVITAAAVKKAYRKATLCVHPDKLQQRGASIQQKYICEKVFDLLKDAWSRFNSEER